MKDIFELKVKTEMKVLTDEKNKDIPYTVP
jgi:hypothetical protein